jgi:hypothetical protein
MLVRLEGRRGLRRRRTRAGNSGDLPAIKFGGEVEEVEEVKEIEEKSFEPSVIAAPISGAGRG